MNRENINRILIISCGVLAIYLQNMFSSVSNIYPLLAVLVSLLWTNRFKQSNQSFITIVLLISSIGIIPFGILYAIILLDLAFISSISITEFKKSMFVLVPIIALSFLSTQFFFEVDEKVITLIYLIYFSSRLITLLSNWDQRNIANSIFLGFVIVTSKYFSNMNHIPFEVVCLFPIVWLLTRGNDNRLELRYRTSFLILFMLLGLSVNLLILYLVIQYLCERQNKKYEVDYDLMPLLFLLIIILAKFFQSLELSKALVTVFVLIAPIFDKRLITSLFNRKKDKFSSMNFELILFVLAMVGLCF